MITPILLDYPILSLFLKFMMASTALLGGVWLLEKVKIIDTPDASEMAWKLAIIASFVALLPVSLSSTSFIIPVNAVEVEWATTKNTHAVSPTVNHPEKGITLSSEPGVLEVPDFNTPPQSEPTPAFPTNGNITWPENIGETNLVSPGKILAFSWLVLALVALAALLVSYRRAIGNLGSRIRVPAEHSANQALRSVCERADIRHVPYLSRSSEINSPVCLPRREICLPDWAFEDMADDALKSLIAHELAHMVRYDPAKIIALQTLCRIFFFQPLFALARRRIEDTAELAADEWAAKQLANASAVAEALYTCAKRITEKRQTQWGLAMAGDKSILKHRIERLISAKNGSFLGAGTGKRTMIVTGMAVLVLAVPGVEFASALNPGNPEPAFSGITDIALAPPVHEDDGGQTDSSFHIESDDGGHESGNLSWNDKNRSIKVSWEGRFSFSEDEKSVSSVSPGSFLSITSGKGADRRRIRYENNDGTLEIDYWEGNKKRVLDKSGERWLAETLETLLQVTAIDMENRVHRYLAAGGTDGALDKMAKLRSAYVKREFLTHLTREASFTDGQLKQLFRMISTLESDFEIRLSMGALLEAGLINEGNLQQALDLANGIDSDYEMRLTLVPLIDRFVMSDDALNKVLSLASKLDSDYELRLLLSSAMSRNDFSENNQKKLLKLAESLESDYELRLVLTHYASIGRTQGAMTGLLLTATNSIEGDYEKRLALAAIIEQSEMNKSAWTTAIQLAETIGGDYEKRMILSQIKERLPDDKNLEKAWLKAAETISGDHERKLLLEQRH